MSRYGLVPRREYVLTGTPTFAHHLAVDRLLEAVASIYVGVSPIDLRGADKWDWLIEPRHVAMWIARNRIGLSYPALGLLFERDHTTVIYAVRKIDQRITEDPDLERRIFKVEQAWIQWPSSR
ncbi:MAG: hypothetical protein F4Z29_07480 [Gemmatimonadetes bacterium]|nr:hypothetical protein [Gemmatimonadota bacterium]